MPKTAAPSPLSLPVNFPDIPPFLVVADVPPETARDVLGPPMLTEWVDGLGDNDFWALEYPCGLQVVIQSMHTGRGIMAYADSPEVNHVSRHFPFADEDCHRISDSDLESNLALLLGAFPERKDEFDSLYSFQVWRQGDDGNPFTIDGPTSERDAKCRVAELDALGHKQLYWYSRISK